MTVAQKARQLTLTLIGEDQNPEPLIEVLVDMARWQRRQMLKDATKVNKKVIDSLWHDAKKGMPKDGARVLIYSCGSNLYLCDVREGNVISPKGYIWNREMTHWLDTEDLFEHKED